MNQPELKSHSTDLTNTAKVEESPFLARGCFQQGRLGAAPKPPSSAGWSLGGPQL